MGLGSAELDSDRDLQRSDARCSGARAGVWQQNPNALHTYNRGRDGRGFRGERRRSH